MCVGFADWDAELWTNQQHLMSRLAHRNRVLFVESLGLRRPQLAGRDLARMSRRLRRGFRGTRARDGLDVLAPLVVPVHGRPRIRTLNAALLRAQVARAARRHGLERPLLWGYVPQAEALVEKLRPSAVVYHCVDDLGAQKGIATGAVRAAEARFAASADLVIASAPALARRMRELNPRTLYAPNVADTDLFRRALEPGPVDPAIDALPRPRVVFTGAVVATKLDVALIAAVARRRPDWSIALVGPVGQGDPSTDVSALRAQSNVHLVGARAYAALPDVLRGAQAAFIPYSINDLTRSVFPMKVYEYLAAGLPVVATPLPALAEVEGIVRGEDAEAMVAALEEAIASDGLKARRERSRLAAGHSWERRIEEIEAALG